jgi:hypothetical protein
MKGVKGVLPLGCLPLWGREGVTLLCYRRFFLNRNTGNFSTKLIKIFLSGFFKNFRKNFFKNFNKLEKISQKK